MYVIVVGSFPHFNTRARPLHDRSVRPSPPNREQFASTIMPQDLRSVYNRLLTEPGNSNHCQAIIQSTSPHLHQFHPRPASPLLSDRQLHGPFQPFPGLDFFKFPLPLTLFCLAIYPSLPPPDLIFKQPRYSQISYHSLHIAAVFSQQAAASFRHYYVSQSINSIELNSQCLRRERFRQPGLSRHVS